MPSATPDLVLAIETSNPSSWTPAAPVMPGVCLGRRTAAGLEVLAVAPVDPRERDDQLMPAVDQAFRTAGAGPRDLASVAVSVGPGGFTAVRIAVTVAKMLAHARGAAVIPVPSAAVAARSARPGPGPFAVVLASKGEDAFVTRFESPETPSGPGAIADASALAALGITRLVADQFLPPSFAAWASSAGVAVEAPVFDPRACLAASLTLPPVDPFALAPLYPREPEAVRKWRLLHPKP